MQKTKNDINKEARAVLKQSGLTHATIVAHMGTGKGHMGLDIAIKDFDAKSVLVISPRSNLTGEVKNGFNTWEVEINKWYPTEKDRFTFDTIQSTYLKSNLDYEMLIIDEIHTCLTSEYIKILQNNKFKYVLGLTGTPELYNSDKKALYQKYAPIIFEYYDSAKDGLINKTKILIFEYELNNNFKVLSGSKKKSFMQGELARYEYLEDSFIKYKNKLLVLQNEELRKIQTKINVLKQSPIVEDLEKISELLEYFKIVSNLWSLAKYWGWWKKGPTADAIAISMKYMHFVRYRKEHLHKLNSSANYATVIKNKILENPDNKVIVFSELISQVSKITEFPYHSKLTPTVKSKRLKMFNEGKIREIGSSKGLTLGLNMKGVNYFILESYVGSPGQAAQKAGRGNRLATDNISTGIIVKVKNTQCDKWFEKVISDLRVESIEYFDDIHKLIEKI